MLHAALTILQFFCAMGICLLVLIQRGKGAEAGAGFGAGASGTVFGARGAGTALSRATAILAAVFMVNSLALAYVGSHTNSQPQKTIFDTAGETAPPPTVPQQPGTLPAGTPPASPAGTVQTPAAPAGGAAGVTAPSAGTHSAESASPAPTPSAPSSK